jgi:pimeloyl-ACP methyl ester carboxylesterase
MPGYGVSDPIEPLTYRTIAERVVGFLDVLELDRADLVGLSFGGMQALHATLADPDRFGRLVLADTSPAFGMDGTSRESWIRSRLAPMDQGATPADIAETVIDSITAAPLTGRIRLETIEGFGRIPVAGFRAAVHCLPDNDIRADLPRIEHPACVVVGELDTETPPSYARALADGLPNSELHVIAGAGHLTPAERPDRFNQLVAGFLGGD